MPSLTGKRNFLSFIAGVGVGEVLPFAALEAVHLLGAVEPLADGVGFRVELAEFVVDKGVVFVSVYYELAIGGFYRTSRRDFNLIGFPGFKGVYTCCICVGINFRFLIHRRNRNGAVACFYGI